MGRLIDKHFNAHDFNPCGVANVFDECSRHDLTKAIVNHLYCSGMSPVADQLQEETKETGLSEWSVCSIEKNNTCAFGVFCCI